MLVEWDTDDGLSYLAIAHRPVARTAHFGDLVAVDLGCSGEPVGVEVLLPYDQITPAVLYGVVKAFPELKRLLAMEGAW